MATKFGTLEKWWKKSFDLCMKASSRALESLQRECESNTTQFVNFDLIDGHFYGNRISLLAGLLGAYDLFRQTEYRDPPNQFVGQFLEKHIRDAKFWGESSTPFLSIAALTLESHGRQKIAEALVLQLVAAIAQANGSNERGAPNPYYGPEESFRITSGLEPLNTESFRSLSYTIEPLIQFIARRWLRQSLSRIWDRITRLFLASFHPAEEWEWFVWRARKGSLEFQRPGTPQSWAALLREADSPSRRGAPLAFSLYPVFTLYYMMVFPHRFQPYLFSLVENWVSKSDSSES